MSRELVFIKSITNGVFKLLVLREKSDAGEDVYINKHFDYVEAEINGAFGWSNILKNNERFVSISSVISYLKDNDVEYEQFRRCIFKTLNILNKLSKELGGD